MTEVYHASQEEKRCAACEKVKLLTAFHLTKYRGTMVPHSYCIDCQRAKDRVRKHLRHPRKTPIIPKATRIGYKVCNTCLNEKPLTEFSHATTTDYAGRCNQCKREQYANADDDEKEQRRLRRKASADARREEIRTADRARSTTDEHRAKRRERERPKREAKRTQKELEKRNAPSPAPVTHKICPACDPLVEKPIEAFGLCKTRLDGHAVYCKACTSIKSHARLDKRRDYERTRMLDPLYRQDQQQKHDARRKRDRIAHPDKYYAINKQVREAKAKDHLLAARLRKNDQIDYALILERDGCWCYICQQPILPHQRMTYDHYIPLVPRRGQPRGTDTEDNIHPAHAICNSRKSNRRFEDLNALDKRGPYPN